MAEKEEAAQQTTHSGAPAARLLLRYREQVVPTLMREFGYQNVMQAPRIERIVVNMGVGQAVQDARALEGAVEDLRVITGQRPVITRARKSIAAFRLRTGMPIGAKVTLRGSRMWHFLDRLTNIALPRVRDFRGVSPHAFDGRGNYTIGLREQLIWPEIDYDKVDRVRGMEVTVVTTARTDEEGRHLLELVGMPFRRPRRTEEAVDG